MPKAKLYSGFNLVEISIVLGLLAVLIIAVVVIVKPDEYKKKARDTKRVSELSLLTEAISEYKLKNGAYPGTLNKLYTSDFAYASPVNNSNYGWIEADLSPFIQLQYIDPINKDGNIYSYFHNETDFELNAILEFKKDIMVTDKGNNDIKFELGTDLELIN